MTPLEKAVEAGNALEMSPDGYWLVSLEPAQVSAIIRAFLEAAAEDEAAVKAVAMGAASTGALGVFRHDVKAAILALKETLG
jgi:hypothetical protein